jgi:hypothetical protein
LHPLPLPAGYGRCFPLPSFFAPAGGARTLCAETTQSTQHSYAVSTGLAYPSKTRKPIAWPRAATFAMLAKPRTRPNLQVSAWSNSIPSLSVVGGGWSLRAVFLLCVSRPRLNRLLLQWRPVSRHLSAWLHESPPSRQYWQLRTVYGQSYSVPGDRHRAV